MIKKFRKSNQIALNEVYGEGDVFCEEMTADLVCPTPSTCMQQTLSATEKIAVPYGSIMSRLHCISVSDK
jgi:hypothetical protein